ncbi:hypothetical protein EWH99_07630 [Sporolactobacillus sp. THM7-7]|nr:hypothetical protein EWH99_07630 [Sporolactobacillus sp. THM7-7]
MFKKFMAAFIALALVFTPAGSFVFHQQDNQVSAKGYRSGVKSFNKSNGNNSLFQNQNRQQKNYNQSGTTATRGMTGGSFMRGLMLGGLSGLLFGSLLSHLGGFGMLAGFLINVLAIVAILALIRYLFVSFRNRPKRKKREDMGPWSR